MTENHFKNTIAENPKAEMLHPDELPPEETSQSSPEEAPNPDQVKAAAATEALTGERLGESDFIYQPSDGENVASGHAPQTDGSEGTTDGSLDAW